MSFNNTEARRTVRQLERQFRLFKDLAEVFDTVEAAQAELLVLLDRKSGLQDDIAKLEADHEERVQLDTDQRAAAVEQTAQAEVVASSATKAKSDANAKIAELRAAVAVEQDKHDEALAGMQAEAVAEQLRTDEAINTAKQARAELLRQLGEAD